MASPADQSRLLTRDQVLNTEPRQKRAEEALQRIISAAAELIEADGVLNLSTETIARKAKVNISTYYKYFSDKQAIIRYIALDLLERQTAAQVQLARQMPECTDWKDAMSQMIDAMVGSWSDFTGFREIQKYFLVDETLHHHYREASREVAVALDRFRDIWNFRGSVEDWILVHVIFGDCAGTMLELAASSDTQKPEKVIEELHKLAHSYLGQHFS